MASRKVTLNFYVSLDLLTVMDAIADSEGLPFARVLDRVLRKGLEIERTERESVAVAKAEGR